MLKSTGFGSFQNWPKYVLRFGSCRAFWSWLMADIVQGSTAAPWHYPMSHHPISCHKNWCDCQMAGASHDMSLRLPCMQSDKFCPIPLISLCPVPAGAKWRAPTSKMRKVLASERRLAFSGHHLTPPIAVRPKHATAKCFFQNCPLPLPSLKSYPVAQALLQHCDIEAGNAMPDTFQ